MAVHRGAHQQQEGRADYRESLIPADILNRFGPPQIAMDRRGFSYQQPYLWVLSPSADLVLAPAAAPHM